jgi:hypothetical protein
MSPSLKRKRTLLPTSRQTRAQLAAAATTASSTAGPATSAAPTTAPYSTTAPAPAATTASSSTATLAPAAPTPTTPAPTTPAPAAPTPAGCYTAQEPDSDSEEYHPAQALPPTLKKPTCTFIALALLPLVCVAEARSNKTLDLLHPSNREAYLVQRVGVVSAALCKSCSRGLGPWKQCSIVADFLKGSCANCHYRGEGKRYSLQPGKLFHFPFTFLIYR